MVESARDEVIPHGVIATYLSACAQARHALIPGAAHALTDPDWNRTFTELILDWAGALLKRT